MRIADVVTYAVQPAGIPLIVAKVMKAKPQQKHRRDDS